MKKIALVASNGGHWIQLLKITENLSKDYSTIRISTSSKNSADGSFYLIPDFSGFSPFAFLRTLAHGVRILKSNTPTTAVISTGALPGLAVCLAARILGVKSIWIDSIANVTKLSLSGRLAKHICSKTYSQWPHLCDGKLVFYSGRIL
ncbi:hypothetical protein M2D07_000710 [Pseudomonas sp. BGr12]|uniref:oligosaccharide biosynthesis protein Alg14 n=1 Tax=unclassified Pseudomonas TaxID=196821 RepID=UPI00177F78BD|nr:oligosaccharide biosynthesis protein Alg14 [Pseudomonas sp. PDM17]MBD9574071.1 oligosaccharide biosynthesis protein Alg14 [Pseudomonas sp. PDM23]MBD9671909.1 oligosaccharide biosynthesis protein Alg14 [Pseudomonas sp. PDM21]